MWHQYSSGPVGWRRPQPVFEDTPGDRRTVVAGVAGRLFPMAPVVIPVDERLTNHTGPFHHKSPPSQRVTMLTTNRLNSELVTKIGDNTSRAIEYRHDIQLPLHCYHSYLCRISTIMSLPWQTLLTQSRYRLPYSSNMYCPDARTILRGESR